MQYKLYTLRHEKRQLLDPLFNSPLTEAGVYNSCYKIVPLLEENVIDVIYVSPFIRCTDTIKLYAIKHNIPVHVDYRLYEWRNRPEFEHENVQQITKTDLDFVSTVSHNDIIINYPEKQEDRKKRVDDFMKMLDEKYKNTKLNILICSHMDIIHDCIKYKIALWPCGYINMGTLIDIEQAEIHTTKILIVYAHFCNFIMPMLHHTLYLLYIKNSLKKQLTIQLKKRWPKLNNHYMIIKGTEFLGLLKKKTGNVYLKMKQCLTEAYLQMK
jgi:broad specificity phosphatase PhoE